MQEDIIPGLLDRINWLCKAAGVKRKDKTPKNVLDNAKIDMFTIKDKHLSSSGGNWNKFIVATAEEARKLVRKIIATGTVISVSDNGLGSLGQKSYKIIIDAGKVIGTKGEHLLRIIVDELGNVWTIFPE